VIPIAVRDKVGVTGPLTLNTYSHVMPELQQDAAKLMDALLTKHDDGLETAQDNSA
jgi:hypothetical protein